MFKAVIIRWKSLVNVQYPLRFVLSGDRNRTATEQKPTAIKTIQFDLKAFQIGTSSCQQNTPVVSLTTCVTKAEQFGDFSFFSAQIKLKLRRTFTENQGDFYEPGSPSSDFNTL